MDAAPESCFPCCVPGRMPARRVGARLDGPEALHHKVVDRALLAEQPAMCGHRNTDDPPSPLRSLSLPAGGRTDCPWGLWQRKVWAGHTPAYARCCNICIELLPGLERVYRPSFLRNPKPDTPAGGRGHQSTSLPFAKLKAREKGLWSCLLLATDRSS